jgi:membrane protease YdiL (CAAX protease family)
MSVFKALLNRRVWYAPVTYLLVMAFLLFGSYFLSEAWGLWGTGVAELVMLGLALLGWAFSGRPFREVFPLRKPTARGVRGSLMVWFGSFLLTSGLSLLLMSFLPEMARVNLRLTEVISSVPFGARLLIVGLAPAVCEEAVHRGVILSGLDAVKPVWPRLLIMGVLFGLFHTDPYRFLPTAILGAAITYAMIKTGSLWVPMLLHGLNNLIPLLATLVPLPEGAEQEAAAALDGPDVWQMTVVYGGLGLLLIMGGVRHINRRAKTDNR